MSFLRTIMGPLGKFTTPKSYKKKVKEGFEEVEELLQKAQEFHGRGDVDAAAETYLEVIDELDKHIFRDNLPLWDITRASLAVALFTIPVSWLGPWWTVAGIGGAITYTLVSTQKVRRESKPKFVKMREETADKYNDLVIKEKGRISLEPAREEKPKKRLKKPRNKSDGKCPKRLKNP